MIHDDRELHDAFARLREAESRTIPPFRVSPRSRWRVPRLAFAALCLVLLVAGGYIARMTRERHMLPPDVTLSTWRAPTDFLLRTPGRELLDSTPRLQPHPPAIRITGGRS